MTSDELRKRGIEYLLAHQCEDIKEGEFTARELSPLLRINESSVYEYMSKLVKEKKWGTRLAFDPEIHKTVKVWWLITNE